MNGLRTLRYQLAWKNWWLPASLARCRYECSNKINKTQPGPFVLWIIILKITQKAGDLSLAFCCSCNQALHFTQKHYVASFNVMVPGGSNENNNSAAISITGNICVTVF
jgi:hypothetical protein